MRRAKLNFGSWSWLRLLSTVGMKRNRTLGWVLGVSCEWRKLLVLVTPSALTLCWNRQKLRVTPMLPAWLQATGRAEWQSA